MNYRVTKYGAICCCKLLLSFFVRVLEGGIYHIEALTHTEKGSHYMVSGLWVRIKINNKHFTILLSTKGREAYRAGAANEKGPKSHRPTMREVQLIEKEIENKIHTHTHTHTHVGKVYTTVTTAHTRIASITAPLFVRLPLFARHCVPITIVCPCGFGNIFHISIPPPTPLSFPSRTRCPLER